MDNNAELLDLVCRLIEIDTVNPPGTQQECTGLLKSRMEEFGFDCKVLPADGVASLIGIIRFPKKGPNVCWIGHWDVVPPGPAEAWTVTAPFRPLIKDGFLYGRGACDMKTAVAAAMYAARDLAEDAGLGGTLVLVVFGDEENGGVRG